MTPESVLVDSNVFIDLLRAGKDPARELMLQYDRADMVTCGVVKAEVLRGIKSSRVRGKMASFFEIMRSVDTPLQAWDDTWHLAWQLDRKGLVLPLTDLCVAACAMRSESAVLTSDHHFDHVPGLVVLRPD